MNLSIIILAAGQGTRMCSARPKVLHPLAGRPLLAHVIDTARELQPADIHVVIGHGADQVQRDFADTDIQWVLQAEQLGTGHAVAQAMPAIPDGNCVLVMYGDVPLVSRATLEPLCSLAEQGMAALLTAELDDPGGYGRILHHADGSICGIVEQKDASASERALKEINTGFVAAPAARLRRWVAALDNNNAQGEFYLTDVIARAVTEGTSVRGVMADDITEVLGINDRKQLAVQERCYQQRQAERCLQAGVTLADPARFDLRGTLTAGEDVLIDVNAVLEGNIVLGNRVSIGPNVVMRNATVGDDVTILANCVIEDAEIGSRSRIGPFARLRPETRLSTNTHIGNFVEIKKSDVGEGSKVNHLSYIGDTSIGTDVNIGAGTITCNYDGANKHRTVIEDDVHIGSDVQLVAPVRVSRGATVGAGTTVWKDTPAGGLVLNAKTQEHRAGWRRPQKPPKAKS